MVEANDSKSAREKLSRQGVIATKLTAADSGGDSFFGFSRSKFGLDARIFFYRELSALLLAGIPLSSSLDTLVDAPDTGSSRHTLAAIRDSVKSGVSFADSFVQHGEGASDYEVTVLEAGERTGSLALGMAGLADFLESRKVLSDSVRSAMIHPIIVGVMALVLAVGLLGFALPKIAEVLEEQGGISLPGLTVFMMTAGKVLAVISLPLVFLITAGVFWLKRQFVRETKLSVDLSEFVFRVPFIGKAYSILVSLRFARTFSLLLAGGVPLLDAMTLAGRATGNIWVKRMVDHEADQVRHGANLAHSVRKIAPLAGMLPRWIEIGEASGSLEKMLSDAADYLQKKWELFINRNLKLLEPLTLVLVGLLVLLVALSVVMPLTALNRLGI